MAAPKPVQDDWDNDFLWRPEEDCAALPVRAAPAPRPVRRFPSGPADIAHILHVEPMRAARRILRITLQHPRISLTQVETGEAAIDLLAMRPYDLVLLSLNLPATSAAGMTASETLGWIRSSATPHSDIPVIGLRDGRHGDRSHDRIGLLMSRGLTDWISRPVSRQTINGKLVDLLPALYDAGL